MSFSIAESIHHFTCTEAMFTCAGVTYMQATTNHTVDLVLALLLVAGSAIGAQIGARATRFLRGDQLLILLASLVLIVVIKMIIGLLLTPASLLDPVTHAALWWPVRLLGQGSLAYA